MDYGPHAVATRGSCIAAFELSAGARKRGEHNPALGRSAVRRTSKKLKSEEAKEAGLHRDSGPSSKVIAGVHPQDSLSPASKHFIDELKGMRGRGGQLLPEALHPSTTEFRLLLP
mmetsp:Transcript_19198/g.53536  ORF Transcript_19198/g.53536 Transcript_19198/m.53536 type:complete len:115 (-) Transcript_19198:17-361(-)